MYLMSDEFELFYKTIRMSDQLRASIQTKYHAITRCINKHYWNSESDSKNSLYVGSNGRGTAIDASDVDMIVMLPDHLFYRYDCYSSNGQSSLLQNLKETLKSTYPQTKMRGDGQVVSLNFNDICFEIVPAFENSDGSFRYPDTNNGGSWKTTDPRSEIESMNRVNDISNKNLKRLCRMMRCWSYYNEYNLPGYLIDSACFKFILFNNAYNYRSYAFYDVDSAPHFDFSVPLDTRR